jgi:hypothetical protein
MGLLSPPGPTYSVDTGNLLAIDGVFSQVSKESALSHSRASWPRLYPENVYFSTVESAYNSPVGLNEHLVFMYIRYI